MKKTIMLMPILLFVVGCAYNPVIDTAGRSGTFNQSKADKITDDVMLCKQLAKKHTIILSKDTKQFTIGILDLKHFG